MIPGLFNKFRISFKKKLRERDREKENEKERIKKRKISIVNGPCLRWESSLGVLPAKLVLQLMELSGPVAML